MTQALGSLQKAMVDAGLVEEVKTRKPRLKQFKCKVCGQPMIRIEDTNTMVCSSYKGYTFYNMTVWVCKS